MHGKIKDQVSGVWYSLPLQDKFYTFLLAIFLAKFSAMLWTKLAKIENNPNGDGKVQMGVPIPGV